MDIRKTDVYAAADRAIENMNRWNVEAFGQLKAKNFESIHLIREVTALYRKSAKKAKRQYYEIAFEAYLIAMALVGEDPKEAMKKADQSITEKWVEDVLDTTDFVTLYRFDSEMERKAYRLAEALEIPEVRNQEIDKALRAWSRQLGQYAINFTDYAMVQAYQDAGIEEVEWITERDDRVCHECMDLDGKIFKIEDLPPKPHLNCRCKFRGIIKKRF